MGLARSPYQINPVPEKFSDGLGRSAWKPLEEGLGIIPEEPLDINLEQGSGSETGQCHLTYVEEHSALYNNHLWRTYKPPDVI